jgi:hypothetical protein
MTITYPQALPPGTQFWKYGPRPGPIAAAWYVLPATIGSTAVTFSITDGQLGDDDLLVNGTIVDQGGPGTPGTPAGIPTLSPWAFALLGLLLAAVALARIRRYSSM